MSDAKKYSDGVIRLSGRIHCARGKRGCKKCQDAAADKKWRIYKWVGWDGMSAVPTMYVTYPDGSTYNSTFSNIDSVDTIEEARKYAEAHPTFFLDEDN